LKPRWKFSQGPGGGLRRLAASRHPLGTHSASRDWRHCEATTEPSSGPGQRYSAGGLAALAAATRARGLLSLDHERGDTPCRSSATTLSRYESLSLGMSLKIEQRLEKPVELRGFEPLTFCMPCRRATSCAIAPQPTTGYSVLEHPARWNAVSIPVPRACVVRERDAGHSPCPSRASEAPPPRKLP
jgi:hypothetical protein